MTINSDQYVMTVITAVTGRPATALCFARQERLRIIVSVRSKILWGSGWRGGGGGGSERCLKWGGGGW